MVCIVWVIFMVLVVVIVFGIGVVWSSVWLFEDGIFYMLVFLLGYGGDDGVIDILLVGLDSCIDVYGNLLSVEELVILYVGDEEVINIDIIILIWVFNNGKLVIVIFILWDFYVVVFGLGKIKINGVYG